MTRCISTDKPIVSIILPTYDRAHILGRAIKSVLNQTLHNFELIIVDDGSTDDTEKVIKEFNDPRIRYLKHDVNRGVCAARNTGIRASTGLYIAFLDSDDEYDPKKLECQIEVLNGKTLDKVDAVTCGVYLSGQGIERRWAPPDFDFEKIIGLRVYIPVAPLCIARKYCDNGILFDENLSGYEEYDIIIRLLQAGCRIGAVEKQLYIVNMLDMNERLTHPNERMRPHLRFMQKYDNELKSRPRANTAHHFRVATDYYKLNIMRGFRHHVLLGIKLCPWYVKPYFFLLASFFGSRVLKIAYRLDTAYVRICELITIRNAS